MERVTGSNCSVGGNILRQLENSMAKRGTSEEVIMRYFQDESADKVLVMYNLVRGIMRKRTGTQGAKRGKTAKVGTNAAQKAENIAAPLEMAQ